MSTETILVLAGLAVWVLVLLVAWGASRGAARGDEADEFRRPKGGGGWRH